MQVSTEFITKYQGLIGAQKTDELIASFLEPVKKAFRLNPLKENFEDVDYSFQKPVPIIDQAYFGEINGNEIDQLAGYVYSQDPAAMFVVQAAEIKEGEYVLDLCAAPGGKSTQIASSLNQTGLLVANEINPSRSKILLENIERWGIKNSLVTNESPERLAQKFPQFFDKIVVDAPCSGEGMFRKDPDAMSYWSQELVITNQKRQQEIVDQAYQMLAPGGRLIYSTCTFAPEEDEQIVEYLLQQYPDLDLIPIPKSEFYQAGHPEWTESNDARLAGCARFWTMDDFGEGQFVAILEKSGNVAVKKDSITSNIDQNTAEIVKKNLADVKVSFPETLMISKDHLFVPILAPEQVKGLKILRNGYEIGQLKGTRIVFHQHFAQILFPSSHPHYEIECVQEFVKFRHGETLKVDAISARNNVLVTYQNKAFSWGKIGQDLILKNFYPKGLRK